ncbi:MAG: hypothetical protein ACHQWV_02955 [Nitrospirales bacterium]
MLVLGVLSEAFGTTLSQRATGLICRSRAFQIGRMDALEEWFWVQQANYSEAKAKVVDEARAQD